MGNYTAIGALAICAFVVTVGIFAHLSLKRLIIVKEGEFVVFGIFTFRIKGLEVKGNDSH